WRIGNRRFCRGPCYLESDDWRNAADEGLLTARQPRPGVAKPTIFATAGKNTHSLFWSIMDEKVRGSRPTGSKSVSDKDRHGTAFWRSPLLSGVHFFKASFTAAHVFSRHTHDEYAIAVIERGAPNFTCRGAARVAPPGSFLLINPDEPHEGRSAKGRSYRMMY